ncbi:uncharacterized protein LOC113754351 [Coffea eugenioides]|uniref:uncharacterized protein LOC113754351 n=1 Tax=Coffea eugenioides TaxID=49369 RepID=UPI000F608CC2|nr:uncharacterized protein LOC113754351 [Coffea eugenioides]
MEDLNGVAADCVVVSCCCQCLILQIVAFILLKLPLKLLRKTKKYAKRLRNRKRGDEILHKRRKRNDDNCWRVHEGSFRVKMEGFSSSELPEFRCCMDDVEKVLEEFCLRGEFGFGRFWDGEVSRGSFPPCLGNQELDYEVVNYHLSQMFGSFNCRRQSLML